MLLSVTVVTNRGRCHHNLCKNCLGGFSNSPECSDMDRCAYCGTTNVPLERDHVPPACLYPPSKKAQGNLQLITVPACSGCNRGYSDDEAHFRTVILMAGDANEAVQELWQKTERSFRKVDGKRRVTEIRKMMVPVKVSGEERHLI